MQGAAAWLCILPAAVCASAWLRADRRAAVLPTRSRHTRHFFGGGQDKSEEKKEGTEEGEEAEEELTEDQKKACEKIQIEIDELKAHAEDKKFAHERLKLEVENYRTRTREELAAARGKAAIPLIKELLPIADEFELAKQNIKVENDGEQAVVDRFNKLFDGMLETWKGLGVEKLKAIGEPFDPELHEAVSMIPSQEYNTDEVCNELRGGWVLKTTGSDQPQVLRPALVCVSSGPGPS